jgi:hypothetical protein
MWFAAHGSLRGQLVGLGVLAYLAYSYAYYLISPEFNVLYLAYVAIVSMSGYAGLYLILSINAQAVQSRLAATTPMRLVAAFLDFMAVLLADQGRLRYGFEAVLFVGVGYALTTAGIAQSGGTPSTPWLAIPQTDYFKWKAFFVAPVTLLCWVLAAGVMHLLSKLFQGRGTFDDMLALLGFAIALPTLVSLLPDFTRAVLTTVGVLSRADPYAAQCTRTIHRPRARQLGHPRPGPAWRFHGLDSHQLAPKLFSVSRSVSA